MPYGTFARLLACWHVKMRSWHAFGMLACKPCWHTSTLAHRPRWHKGMHGTRFSKLICQILFSVKLHNFSMKYYKLKTASWIFFSEFCKIFQEHIFTGLLLLLLIFRKIQTFNSHYTQQYSENMQNYSIF